MNIQLIRHATLLITVNGRRILVDPMLSPVAAMPPVQNSENENRNPLVDLHVDLSSVQNADAVLLTHTHRDHFDEEAIRRLPNDMPFFCQEKDVDQLRDYGFENITSIQDPVTWNDIEFTRTMAQHGSEAMSKQMGPVSGFILRIPNEPTVYITGDTIWYHEVETTIQTVQPDIIIASAGAAQFLTGGPITMTAEDIVKVCECAPNSKVIAVHMEAWNHCVLTRSELQAVLEEHRLSNQVIIPGDGESVEFQVTAGQHR